MRLFFDSIFVIASGNFHSICNLRSGIEDTWELSNQRANAEGNVN